MNIPAHSMKADSQTHAWTGVRQVTAQGKAKTVWEWRMLCVYACVHMCVCVYAHRGQHMWHMNLYCFYAIISHH